MNSGEARDAAIHRALALTPTLTSIEQARELAEEEGTSGAGVVVTGSVVTAGEARRLFGLEPS